MKSTPKIIRGCIAASPNLLLKKILEEAYLFFLAFFFAGILFSSHHSKISAEPNGGARCQFQCIVSASSLVKKKVIVLVGKRSLPDRISLLTRTADVKFFGETPRFPARGLGFPIPVNTSRVGA
jgi:hypothetical protein